jgi:tetratricopeptide (TPR) repeat protein
MRKHKKVLFIPVLSIIILLSVSNNALAQKLNIEGQVLDQNDGPIPGVVVSVYRGQKYISSSRTSQDGNYRIDYPSGVRIRVTYYVDDQSKYPEKVEGISGKRDHRISMVLRNGDVGLSITEASGFYSTVSAQFELDVNNGISGNVARARFDRLMNQVHIKLEEGETDAQVLALYGQAAHTLEQLGSAKHLSTSELIHQSNAFLAQVHYQTGVDLFNQRKRNEAKPHFETAVTAIKKAIEEASKAADTNKDLLVYYGFITQNALVLVEQYGSTGLVDETVKAINKAEALDTENKNRWGIFKGELYRSAGRTDDAIAAYKSVLAADPNQVDALYGLGLTLITSGEREQIREGADVLALFASKAPATDKRVPIAKEALEGVKNEYKVEAEKPSKKNRKP